jgi:CheY-like chemotaxis protein
VEDLEQLQSLVREALEHLYDHSFLETHPLAQVLARRGSTQGRGRALQQILLDAVQALKPPPDLPYESLAWRKYRYLFLRYVQGQPAEEIADDLGIGLRQSRRYAREAMTAVTLLLWDQYREQLQAGSDPADAARSRAESESVAAGLAETEAGLSPTDQELSQVQAGMRPESAPLSATLAGVVATIQPLVEKLGVGFVQSLPESLESAIVERTSVRHALLNLISLCLENGGSAMSLEAKSRVQAHEATVVLKVALPRSVRENPTDLTRDHRWTLARRILEQQQGGLKLSTVNAESTLLELTLALAQGRRILLVEDNVDAIQLYTRYLSGLYSVSAITDGARALESIEREKPTAIVLDVMMPGKDGWEILQHLKSDPQTRDIPVVICSVLKERDLALALGAGDFLAKPVAKAELLRSLDRLIASPRLLEKHSQAGS